MNKIPTLFKRDSHGRITDEVADDCRWVLDGHGAATEKLDGVNVRLTVRNGWLVRTERRCNPTKEQQVFGIVDPWYCDADPNDPSCKHIIAAALGTDALGWPDGEHCCEAIGPKIQGNPLGLDKPICVPFGLWPPIIPSAAVDRTFDGLRDLLLNLDSVYSPGHLAEGIVFHWNPGHEVLRAKIKRRDFEALDTAGGHSTCE